MGASVLDERRLTAPCGDHADLVGDRYRLGPVLRRSSGCCAHRAHDDLLQRTVSVTLVAGAPDSFALAPQCWQDRGPEVAELYDAGSDGDHLFLVTQHPEQPTLAETTPPGGLDVGAVRDLGTAVATALLPRHQHGAVHGGLGAGTVAWSPRGTSLADFGLLPWLARWGAVPVAPPFPAPEQRRGTPDGPASDVYALGRLLGELAPPRGVRPGLRGLLEDMTADSPAARPTLDEVLRRLAAVPSGRPFQAVGQATRSTLERHGRRVGLAAAACCIVGLGVALAAAGTAPAAPRATMAVAAPAAMPPFALHLQVPDADPTTAASTAPTSPDTTPVADAAGRRTSWGSDDRDDDGSSSSHSASTARGSSGTTHTTHYASSDADHQDAPSKPTTSSKGPAGSEDHRSHGLGSVLGGLTGSSGDDLAKGHDTSKDDSAKEHSSTGEDSKSNHSRKKLDDSPGAFGL